MSKAQKALLDAVLGYVPKENRSEQLGAGDHTVRLTAWQVTDSRKKWDGSQKDNLPAFKDPTPQLGIEFRDKDGVVGWHRFNMWGYKRYDDLTEKERESGKYEPVQHGSNEYACRLYADGSLARVQDPKRTSDAQSFVDQFMGAVGMIGTPVGEAMDELQALKTEFNVELESEEYDGRVQIKVAKFKAAVGVATSEFGE